MREYYAGDTATESGIGDGLQEVGIPWNSEEFCGDGVGGRRNCHPFIEHFTQMLKIVKIVWVRAILFKTSGRVEGNSLFVSIVSRYSGSIKA